MSHIQERKEKDCLNCGTIVQGHYCHKCGQENVVPKETFWHMFSHFFYDLTHFDSSFFHTIHHLIIRPGFLSREYLLGRRASYLHPVRMYVFTSAVFFLLFFSFFSPGEDAITINPDKPLGAKQRANYIVTLEKQLKKDTGNVKLKSRLVLIKDTTRPFTSEDILGNEEGRNYISFTGIHYKSAKEYDSLQNTMLPGKKDGWFKRRIVKKEISINSKYRNNPSEANKKFAESIFHKLPYMLFVSLPLFALILKLVYIRRRKEFYFADHGVFTIHLYVFTFLLMLAVFSMNALEDITGKGFFTLISVILVFALFFYLYKAMRKFYGQGRVKTFFKFILVTILSLIMMSILFLLFLFFSAITL
ncbi:MAG: DUF3667 domain-containing protein [Bacteroidota bacterium]